MFIFFGCKNQKTTPKNEDSHTKKPNILFILVDDLGINDLGFTGSKYYETPNIDQLATKSTVFTQGYSASQVCSPARASILLGKFTARHGITDWIGAKTGENWRTHNRHDLLLPAANVEALPKEDLTLAEAMKANGYHTFFAGKWHLGDEGSFPEDHGFDINVGGFESGSPRGGYFSPYKNPKLKDGPKGENLTERLAIETAQFMESNQSKPFFAFLSFYAVHGPIQTTQEKWTKYRAKAEQQGIEEKGFMMEKKLPIRQVQDNPIYGGLVESMDDAVGIVLKALKEYGLDKNTIVIFTSDNGGVASGDAFSTSNLPYKGGKGYHWEGGIRAPYLIYIPWNQSSNQTFDTPVTGADFYPTILDYANIDLLPNQHLDGISLKPFIQNNKKPAERPLYWHYPHYGNQGGDPSSIIREGKWKLIYFYEEEKSQLYNLETDPFEQKDVATEFSKKTSELEAKLKNWLTAVNAKYPKKDEKFDTEARKKYDENIRTERIEKLEQNRLKILQVDFTPNKDWWKSKLTED